MVKEMFTEEDFSDVKDLTEDASNDNPVFTTEDFDEIEFDEDDFAPAYTSILDSLKDRAKVAGAGGLPLAAVTGDVDAAIDASSTAGKIVAQTYGAILGKNINPKFGAFVGAVAGPTLVEGMEQIYRKMALGGEIDPREIGKEALITGALELVSRGAGNFFMKNPRITAEVGRLKGLVSKTRKSIESMIDSNPMLRTVGGEIDNIFKDATSKAKTLPNNVRTFIGRWKKALEPDDIGRVGFTKETGEKIITFSDVDDLIGDVDDALRPQYKLNADGSSVEVPRNARGLKMLREIRKNLEEVRKRMAKSAGEVGEAFIKYKDELANMYDKVPKKVGGDVGDLVLKGTVGSTVGMVTGNPLLGVMTGAGLITTGRKGFQDFLYKSLEKTGIGRAATIGLTEFLRKSAEAPEKTS